MQDQRPPKPFKLLTSTNSKAESKTNSIPTARVLPDKDNAQPRIKPPNLAQYPAPNLAPHGMSGIKTMAARQQAAQHVPKQPFKAGNGGELSKVFKPIAAKSPDKGHDRSR
jgi:hypothetical protein